MSRGGIAACLLLSAAALARGQAPADDDPPAEKTYLAIDVLKGVPGSRIPVLMADWSKALGVKCDHCHEGETFEVTTKPAHETARRMVRMSNAVSDSHLKAEGGVTCWSCHRGSLKPAKIGRDALDAALAAWPPDVAGVDDERKLQMSVYSASLGVSCDHCHAPGRWRDASKKPHATAVRMASMFAEFPKHAPQMAGQTQCFTCHHGAAKVEKAAPRPRRTSPVARRGSFPDRKASRTPGE